MTRTGETNQLAIFPAKTESKGPLVRYGESSGSIAMFDFIVGMLLGSLMTLVPVLIWDRIVRSRAERPPKSDSPLIWHPRHAGSTDGF